MESLELNKIVAAVLTAGIAFSALGLISDGLEHPHRLKESVLKIKGVVNAGAPAAAAAPKIAPIAPLLAKADPSAGEAFTHKICIACHNFTEGGGAKVGPDLYGVVGREKASAPGFSYSAALKKLGGKWTFSDLNDWLYHPAAYAPGTKMAYAGIEDNQMRANVIDYLHTLSKNPEPLPKVTEADKSAAAAGGAAPAGQAASAAAPDFDTLLAKADPAHGEAFTKKICVACHNFNEGGGAKLGPDLYGVVGRDKASFPGFHYSDALKKKGGKWTLADLNEWLTKPSAYAPGTKMTYTGIGEPQLRADVVDYLRTLSHNPEPLPAAATGSKAAAPAAATGSKAGAPAAPAAANPQGSAPSGQQSSQPSSQPDNKPAGAPPKAEAQKPASQEPAGKQAPVQSGASSEGSGKPQ